MITTFFYWPKLGVWPMDKDCQIYIMEVGEVKAGTSFEADR